MNGLRTIGLGVLFAAGVLVALVLVALPIFVRSLRRGARSFHPRGTVCRAEIVALDDLVGPRLAGPARVRLSGATADESSADPTILGMAIALGGGEQDLPLATFESFVQTAAGRRNTDVTDYLRNEYASVTPWRVRDRGIRWLRAIPDPAATHAAKPGDRVTRLDQDLAAGRARFTLEVRTAPNADGPVDRVVAELRLLERLPADDDGFRISMVRTGRGLAPTGFRNGIRAVGYPVSQLARRLRGG